MTKPRKHPRVGDPDGLRELMARRANGLGVVSLGIVTSTDPLVVEVCGSDEPVDFCDPAVKPKLGDFVAVALVGADVMVVLGRVVGV